MTALAIYHENGDATGEVFKDVTQISQTLAGIGVMFERWQTDTVFSSDADQEEVLAAYADSIQQLRNQYPVQSIDVVALKPDNPQKEDFRQKFLSEHTHADFEIRFFVEGNGLFYLHVADKVYLMLCEKGDLISVPANTTHWFDMGANPDFKCIRLFTSAEGWVGQFTGSEIARHFPDMDEFVSGLT